MPRASIRTLYLKPGLLLRAHEVCIALHIPNLFRELVIEAVRLGELPPATIFTVCSDSFCLSGVKGLVAREAAQLSPNNLSKGAPETRSGSPRKLGYQI